MTCYLIRHGKDDESVRGGWSETSLSMEGVVQIRKIAQQLAAEHGRNSVAIFSSDLLRTKQSALILSEKLNAPVAFLPQFREVNNGALAGMKNEDACLGYPGLYWNTLAWEECYPQGESPKQFYERICNAWDDFKKRNCAEDRIEILVTHGGVINVILHLENQIPYSNRQKGFSLPYASVTKIEF